MAFIRSIVCTVFCDVLDRMNKDIIGWWPMFDYEKIVENIASDKNASVLEQSAFGDLVSFLISNLLIEIFSLRVIFTGGDYKSSLQKK